MNNAIVDYFKTQPVLKVWLFGSFARGEQRPWSDVDILVRYDRRQPIGLMKAKGYAVQDIAEITGLTTEKSRPYNKYRKQRERERRRVGDGTSGIPEAEDVGAGSSTREAASRLPALCFCNFSAKEK